MRKFVTAAAVTLSLLSLAPLSIAPAQAAIVTKRVISHHGPYGHGCRTVVKTVRAHGRMVRSVRRVCR